MMISNDIILSDTGYNSPQNTMPQFRNNKYKRTMSITFMIIPVIVSTVAIVMVIMQQNEINKLKSQLSIIGELQLSANNSRASIDAMVANLSNFNDSVETLKIQTLNLDKLQLAADITLESMNIKIANLSNITSFMMRKNIVRSYDLNITVSIGVGQSLPDVVDISKFDYVDYVLKSHKFDSYLLPDSTPNNQHYVDVAGAMFDDCNQAIGRVGSVVYNHVDGYINNNEIFTQGTMTKPYSCKIANYSTAATITIHRGYIRT